MGRGPAAVAWLTMAFMSTVPCAAQQPEMRAAGRPHVLTPAPPKPPQPTPEIPRTVAPPQEREDLFLARPRTYAPRYDRLERRPGRHPWRDRGSVFLPGTYYDGLLAEAPADSQRDREAESDRRLDDEDRPRPIREPVAPPAAYVPSPPGPPRTFYVIPGCFAGDKMPRADELPAGCDIRSLRKVDPR